MSQLSLEGISNLLVHYREVLGTSQDVLVENVARDIASTNRRNGSVMEPDEWIEWMMSRESGMSSAINLSPEDVDILAELVRARSANS